MACGPNPVPCLSLQIKFYWQRAILISLLCMAGFCCNTALGSHDREDMVSKTEMFLLWPLAGKSLPTPNLEHYRFGRNRFIGWSIHSFIEQIIIHHLKCSKHFSRFTVSQRMRSIPVTAVVSPWHYYPILQMVKRSLEKDEWLFQGHLASKWQNQDWNHIRPCSPLLVWITVRSKERYKYRE